MLSIGVVLFSRSEEAVANYAVLPPLQSQSEKHYAVPPDPTYGVVFRPPDAVDLSETVVSSLRKIVSLAKTSLAEASIAIKTSGDDEFLAERIVAFDRIAAIMGPRLKNVPELKAELEVVMKDYCIIEKCYGEMAREMGEEGARRVTAQTLFSQSQRTDFEEGTWRPPSLAILL